MNKETGEDITRIYSAMGHPLRKKILEIIGQDQRVGFKDLKDALKVSVGTLYFHLEILGDLLEQDDDRKYSLTDKGRLALKLLGSGDEQLEISEGMLKKQEGSLGSRIVKDVVFGRSLLSSVISNPKRFIPEVAIILGFGAWLFANARVEPIMMFYNNQPTWSSSLVIVSEFVISWVGVFGLCELFSYVFYRRMGGEAPLFIGTLFSLVPLLIPLSILQLDSELNLGLHIGWLLTNVLLLVFQVWVLCLLSATLSLAKGLRIEKAVLISMIVMYFNIGLLVVFFIL